MQGAAAGSDEEAAINGEVDLFACRAGAWQRYSIFQRIILMKALFLALWAFRHFIASSIRADFKARFVRSRLGGLWMIINPLASAAIYAVVLSQVMAAKLPGNTDKAAYAIYLLSGMLAWSMFADVLGRSTTLFIDNANLLKKVRFPRICLPAILVGSCLLNNLLLLGATLIVFVCLGHFPGIAALWVMPLIFVNLLFSAGLGLLIGVINVFARDVGQIIPVILQLLFWLTPIVYMPHILPGGLYSVIQWNPMYWMAQGYQNALLFNVMPPLSQLAVVTVIALVLMVTSLFLFRRASPEMVDVL